MADRKSFAARAVPAARAAFTTRLLLGLAPFTAFVLLTGLSLSMALWVAFGLAFTLGLQAFLESGRIRAFDAANALVFAALAIFSGFIPVAMTAAGFRLIAECLLLAFALVSLLSGRPFTRQFALDGESRPHIRLSLGWGVALALMSLADAAAIFLDLPETAAAIAGLVVLAGALTFTLRTPG